jgi:hypothetical protein
MTERLTREETESLIGLSDAAALIEVLELGITRAELAEARAWLENDEAMLNEGRPAPTGRVARLIGILKAGEDEDLTGPDVR